MFGQCSIFAHLGALSIRMLCKQTKTKTVKDGVLIQCLRINIQSDVEIKAFIQEGVLHDIAGSTKMACMNPSAWV